MDARDLVDLRKHPEWFEVQPLCPDPLVYAELYKRTNNAQARRDLQDQLINPPVVITRKPTPFVLPIRGSAL